MSVVPRLLPVVDDDETGGFWHASSEHRLVLRTCNACAATLHLPKSYCHHCGSWDVGWREVDPAASLYSWTVLHHSIHPAFPAPSTVVLVELDHEPGVRFVGHLDGAPELTAGMPMRLRFEDAEPGVTLPQWDPVRHEQQTAGHEPRGDL